MRLGLTDGVLFKFDYFLALDFLRILLDSVLLHALHLVDAETDIMSLEIELPDKQAIGFLYQNIIDPNLTSLNALVILPETHSQIESVVYF